MRQTDFSIIRIFHSLVCIAIITGAANADPAADPGSHVGVIDLKMAYENLQETVDSQQANAAMQEHLQRMAKSHQMHLKDEKDVTARQNMNLEFENQEEALKIQIVRAQAKQLKQAYSQIQAAVADLAKTRNLDLVLVGRSPDLPPAAYQMRDVKALANIVFDRGILYASDQMDLTAEVIARLNKSYKSPPSTAVGLPVTPMQIGSKTYTIEIAANDASREHGLMERDTLPADHGMIFVFAKAEPQAFWMRHTRFPLDVVFADDHGKVVSTDSMKPYDETTITRSQAPAKYAIELGAGELTASGIKPGDQLNIPAAVDAALSR